MTYAYTHNSAVQYTFHPIQQISSRDFALVLFCLCAEKHLQRRRCVNSVTWVSEIMHGAIRGIFQPITG